MSQKEAELAEGLRKKWSARMTEEEVAYLRDTAAFIDFAIRNGLTFPTVVLSVMGDLNEIVHAGCDYHSARARGFRPKVGGYSKLASEEFGESEEDEPPE